ncbi:response regulator [Tropicimonas sp. IMCC34043]|uniref:response regulator n=1 Tax=Tropicimonas sp. IMCC34043 TaxID=2248760 RepID=UPI000E21D2FE|nr:response regulator [Tropicimonas sp. IMCC34043]
MTKVLIVEDNEMNLDMLSRRLSRKGFTVISARDGEAAVRTCREAVPDVVLMDMSLPVMDGWTATRALKGDPATEGIPVIALTAHAMEADREKALAAGCDAFATKPIDLPDLLATIDSLLSG